MDDLLYEDRNMASELEHLELLRKDIGMSVHLTSKAPTPTTSSEVRSSPPLCHQDRPSTSTSRIHHPHWSGPTKLDLLGLPDVVLCRILEFLSYDDVAKFRSVSRKFDHICQSHLNRGFRQAERFHCKLMRDFKSRLPRRESERRSHPLIRHCDILTAIETRISLLAMTFMKYIEVNSCCFIPGKVIDEIFDVLRKIQNDKALPRAYEVLQELRDISSMAMEYFDEHIAPTLKANNNKSPSVYLHGLAGIVSSPSPCATLRDHPATPNTILDKFVLAERRYKSTEKRNRRRQSDVKKELSQFKQSLKDQNCTITNLETLVSSQQSLITGQNEKLKEQENKISELSRKILEMEKILVTKSPGGGGATQSGGGGGGGGKKRTLEDTEEVEIEGPSKRAKNC